MAADKLFMLAARASAPMISTQLNRDNLAPLHVKG